MAFSLNKEKSVLTLRAPGRQEVSFYVSKRIPEDEMKHADFNEVIAWSPADKDIVKIEEIDSGWKIIANGENNWRRWCVKTDPSAIIFPTREGEFISNLNKIQNYGTYTLSYPGTASSKCIVLFTTPHTGIVVGSKPDLKWAKISLTRFDKDFILQIFQNEKEMYIFPFDKNWKQGVREFSKLLIEKKEKPKKNIVLNKPRFQLQMGVRDFFGNTTLSDFSDMLPLIKEFRKILGPGNIVHFFGTNPYGFDCNFPDFTIDPKLGGLPSFKRLVGEIHKMDLYASHHFNPRIADFRWLEKHPQYKDAIVMNLSGNPWVEFYKNNIYYTMNPGNKRWIELCLDIIRYLKNTGVDFIEIDQIAYQRNLYTSEGGFGYGYQNLLNLVHKESVKFWIEGVSDIFNLPEDCFFQVLPRDRYQLWETNENRRGYVYGSQFTLFYRTLMPHAPISYQVVTEKAKVNLIPKRLRIAMRLNAQVYDLELGFVDKMYRKRMNRTLVKISNFLKKHNIE